MGGISRYITSGNKCKTGAFTATSKKLIDPELHQQLLLLLLVLSLGLPLPLVQLKLTIR